MAYSAVYSSSLELAWFALLFVALITVFNAGVVDSKYVVAYCGLAVYSSGALLYWYICTKFYSFVQPPIYIGLVSKTFLRKSFYNSFIAFYYACILYFFFFLLKTSHTSELSADWGFSLFAVLASMFVMYFIKYVFQNFTSIFVIFKKDIFNRKVKRLILFIKLYPESKIRPKVVVLSFITLFFSCRTFLGIFFFYSLVMDSLYGFSLCFLLVCVFSAWISAPDFRQDLRKAYGQNALRLLG